MKFTIEKSKLTDALNKMGRIMTAKPSIPILGGILVRATADCLILTASDGTESIIHRIPVSEELVIEEEGVSVLAKEAIDISKKFKGTISYSVDGPRVKVSQAKTFLEFSTLDANDYPTIAASTNPQPIVMNGKDFSAIVTKTAFATAKTETRPILTGVHMLFAEEGNVFVATDSHRLGKISSGKGSKENEMQITVPAKLLDHALKSFDLSKDVIILPDERQLALANGDTILYSRLLEGNYPDVSRLIPTDFETKVVVNRQEMLDTIDLISALSTNSTVDLKANGLFLEVEAVQEGKKGKREIAFEEYEGDEGFSISFSAQYVAEALKSMESSSVRFNFNGSMKPFVIEPIQEDCCELQLVLPVRQT